MGNRLNIKSGDRTSPHAAQLLAARINELDMPAEFRLLVENLPEQYSRKATHKMREAKTEPRSYRLSKSSVRILKKMATLLGVRNRTQNVEICIQAVGQRLGLT
jgi:hypothetical protein